jgi:cytochrome c biogenesis protein CcdA
MNKNKKIEILLWVIVFLVIFVVASIFGWSVLYGVIIPKASNLTALTTLGILGFAFVAGFIANFGPCSLGVLPAYMSFYLGMDEVENNSSPIKKSIKLGAIASLGAFFFFIVLGLLFASVGTFLTAYASQLKIIVAVLIFFIGLAFWHGKSIRIRGLSSFTNKVGKMSRGRTQAVSLFGFGIVYGAGGLMCFLPIFLPLVFFPIIGGEFLVSIASFLIFSLAQALFLIAATVFIGQGKHTFFKTMIGKTPTMKKVAGGVLILTSIWMFAIFFIWGM